MKKGYKQITALGSCKTYCFCHILFMQIKVVDGMIWRCGGYWDVNIHKNDSVAVPLRPCCGMYSLVVPNIQRFSFEIFLLSPSVSRRCTEYKVSIFGVILVRISPHTDWIRRDTEYLSVFSPNAGKYGPEQLRIGTLFKQ